MDVVTMIAAEANRQGVPAPLAIEVANQESGLNPNTPDSSAGAIGLFQLEPATAADLGVNPRIIAQNIEGGIRYLKQQLARFSGDVSAALAAYDWGPKHVQQAIGKYGTSWIAHVPRETANYVRKILAGLAQYQPSITPASVAHGITEMIAPPPVEPGAPATDQRMTYVIFAVAAIAFVFLARQAFE